jgi:ketosteroid isomerase-like protein
VTEIGDQEIAKIRGAYEAFNRGDFDDAAEMLHSDVVWHPVADFERPFSGRRAAREYMNPQVWASQHNEIHSIEPIDDRFVLVDSTFHGEGEASGIKLDQRGFHLWRLEDGKAIEFRFFLDRDEAVRAARS